MVRLANGISEKFVSIRDNRFEYLNGPGNGDVVDLVSSGTVQKVEIINNHVEQDGSASLIYKTNSPVETISGNTSGKKGAFTDIKSIVDAPGIPASPLAPVLPQDLKLTGTGISSLGLGW